MAAPTGTYQGYQAVGEREDLSDIIYDISPMDTPFMSNIQRSSATAVYHEWQTDALAAAAVNSQTEGGDATTDTATATARLGNYTNISAKYPRVSGTLRKVATAGRRDELSYQISKRGRELKRDIETALCGGQAATAGAAAGARVVAGLGAWLADNQVLAANGGTAPTTGTTAATTSGTPGTAQVTGTAGTLLEADLKSVIKACWDDGGDPGVIMTGSFAKQSVSGLSGIGTLYRDAQPNGPVAPGSIIGAADVYVSDFGQHQVVANRFQPAGNVYVLDLEYFCCAYLRPIQTETLSKTGDSDRSMIIAEFTLEVKNEASSGILSTVLSS